MFVPSAIEVEILKIDFSLPFFIEFLGNKKFEVDFLLEEGFRDILDRHV